MTQRPQTSIGRLLDWVGGHELSVLLVATGFIGSVWGFCALADEVMEGDTLKFDRILLLATRVPGSLTPRGPAFLQNFALDVTALGGVNLLSLLTLTVTGFLLLGGRKKMAVFLTGSIVSGTMMSVALKAFFDRPRPEIVPHAVAVSTSSFPSGHSVMSAIVYLTMGALLARAQRRTQLKAYVILAALGFTFLVGVSRVYLGVHWPSDVLAGWTAGGAWSSLCWLVARWLQRRHALEAENGVD